MIKTLIVEDNFYFRESLVETLRSPSFDMSISEAKDGKEALQKVNDCHPDVIFMDLQLPGENGLQLTKKIKALYPKTVVIILTSHDLPEYRDAAFGYGANDFLCKSSFTRQDIARVIKKVSLNRSLDKNRVRRTS